MPSRLSLEKQIALFSLNDKNVFLKFLKFLEPEDLENSTYSKIFELQKKHYMSEGVLHDKSFLIEMIKEDYEKKGITTKELDGITEKEPAIESKTYILEEVLKISKKNRLLNGLNVITTKVDDDDFSATDIEAIVRKSLAVNYDTDLGMSIWDYEERFQKLSRQVDFAVPSFSEKLNGFISKGRYPGELYVYMAPPGVGKSVFLVQDAYKALRLNYKVLIVTLELSQERVGLRIDSLHTKMEQKEIFKDFESVKRKYEVLKKVCHKGDILIKEYPTKGASVLDLSIFLDELAIYKEFVPDIIFVDYGDIMKPVRMRDKDYSEQGEIFEGLRKLAKERNIPVVTATQTTRDALEKHHSKIDMSKISDSFIIARIADAIYALCQTEEDRENNKIYMKIIKNRNGPQNIVLPYKIDYPKMAVYDMEDE
jgi:replicative DNA helicase